MGSVTATNAADRFRQAIEASRYVYAGVALRWGEPIVA